MTVGLWITPVALASVFVILWAATWLEHFVDAPAFVRPISQAAHADHADLAVEVVGIARQPAGALRRPPTQTTRSQRCTSE